jgi:asparagine N-glycosylation enzyme membrane subunit Stt3
MKTIKFIAFLFYRYYSKGRTKDIPYVSTLCALVLLLLIHIFQILVIFNIMYLLPLGGSKIGLVGLMRYVQFLIIIAPLFLLFSLLLKKKELKALHYDERKIKRGRIALIIYSILSFSFLIFLSLLKKHNN